MTSASRSRRRSRGTEKEIEFRGRSAAAQTCTGSGRGARDRRRSTCPQCEGRGEVRSVRQTMLGQMVNVSACPRCRGEGRIVETPCETCRGRWPDRAQAHAAGHDPGGHRRGPPDPPDAARARSGRAAARRAACTSRSTSRRTRRSSATGPSSTTRRGLDRPGRARHHPRSCRRSTATRRSRSSPERSPTRRSGCAARASRTCAGRASRGRPACARRRRACPRSCRRSSASCSRRTPRNAGETVGGGRRAPRQARARGDARRRRRGRTRGWSWRSRPTSRRSRPSARSSAASRPAGRRVEPAFDLVDEGLGARVDPRRPAIVRGYVPGARSGAARARPSTQVGRGARPPAGVRAAADRRAAAPGSCTRPTGPRPGRRTSRSCASVDGSSSGRRGDGIGALPTTSSSRSIRAWPSGPGSTRRRACAWPRSSRLAADGRLAARAGARRRLRIGDPRDRGASGSGRPRRPRRSTPTRSRSRPRLPTRGGTRSADGSGPRHGQPAERRAAVRCRARQPHRRRSSCRSPRTSRRAAPRRLAARVRASSSTAKARSGRRSRAPGWPSRSAWPEGDWVALEAQRGGPEAVAAVVPDLQSGAMPASLFPLLLVDAHRAWPSGCSCPRSSCRSRCARDGATVESESGLVRGAAVGPEPRHAGDRRRAGADRARARVGPRADPARSSRGCSSP